MLGVVTALADASEHDLSPPREVLEHSLPPDLVALAPWIAAEYCSTPARALTLMLPPRGTRTRRVLRGARGARAAARRAPDRAPARAARVAAAPRRGRPRLAAAPGGPRPGDDRAGSPCAARPSTSRSARAPVRRRRRSAPISSARWTRIAAADPGEQLLLHGVTGSGKTEVYLRAAEDALDDGRTVLVLVPEIALTPQIVARFRERFGDTVAVMHSALTPGARYDEWLRLRRGEARICVGPRSRRLRAARTDRPDRRRRGARRLLQARGRPALRRAPRRRAPRRAITARCSSRAARRRAPSRGTRCRGSRCPSASTARRCHRSRSSTCSACAASLHPRTHAALVDARKSIVLLNRRGWSNYLTCQGCGRAWECPACDVTLVLHRAERRDRLPPLRPPRARTDALPGLRVGLDRAARHGHRASRARAARPGLPARRRRRRPGADPRRVPGRRARRAARHADGRQGPRLPGRRARRRARRRPDAALPGLPRRGAHVRARRAARRARRPRRGARAA